MLRTKEVCGAVQNAGERAQWVKHEDLTLDAQHTWEGTQEGTREGTREPDPRHLLASQGS